MYSPRQVKEYLRLLEQLRGLSLDPIEVPECPTHTEFVEIDAGGWNAQLRLFWRPEITGQVSYDPTEDTLDFVCGPEQLEAIQVLELSYEGTLQEYQAGQGLAPRLQAWVNKWHNLKPLKLEL